MSDFDDLLGGYFGSGLPKPPTRKPEKGIPWEAKVIDGDYYVPLAQVAELLKMNDSLPAVRKGIETRVEAQAERKRLGMT